ncbi:DNA adenine methylase [Catellatospora methionotrophica]|uniref:DNA adenine methylase n=1 Tax=Catellatospora methionotrophica TaxID=121620 RepID=UPI00140B4A4F|nr:DNA adenine methylase [Catellatospora methionotrophica]
MPVTLPPRRLPGLADAPHAIPYQGSKRRLAHAIVPLLPPDTARLLEPFAGSAAVAIAARHLRIGETAEISDVNEPLMRLWQRVLAEPLALAADYERLWHEQLTDPKAYYDAVRTRFNETHEPHCLLYLLARCVKAAVRYNREGGFNQGPDRRRLGARPDAMRLRLTATARVLTGCRAYTADYADVLSRACPDDVVYLDPPYQGVSQARDHRYMAGMPREAFVARLREAVTRGTSFLLSYDGLSRDGDAAERTYGDPLPTDLGLLHLHLDAGTSSQATLNGRHTRTVESLYLSPALATRLGGPAAVHESLTAPVTEPRAAPAAGTPRLE